MKLKLYCAALLSVACAAPALADGNDSCPGAAIAALPFNDTGTTLGANNTVNAIPASCNGNYTQVAGPDKIYRLVVSTGGSLNISVDPTGANWDPSIYLVDEAISACATTPVTAGCVGGADGGGSNVTEDINLASIPAGTYNLYVDSFYSTGALSAGAFSLSVTGTAVLGGGTSADTGITKTNGTTTTTAGTTTTYTITATNLGPGAVTNATVADTFPAACTSVSWTCAGGAGGSCTTANGTGNINNTVTLPVNGTATFTAQCAVNAGATGTLSNTATVTNPGGTPDPQAANNSATDTDTLVAPAVGNLTIAPTALAFGNVGVGTTSAAQSVTLGNSGTGSLQVTALTAATAPFALSGGTCGAVPITIPAGANCTLNYTYGPTVAGASNQTLTVTADAPGSGTIGLSGTGVAGTLALSATNLALGGQSVGASAQATLTISNTGSGTITVTSVGAPTAPFSINGGTCAAVPFTLTAGGSCTVIYRFSPTVAGAFSQLISILSDGGNLDVTLSGTGVVAIPLNTLSNWSTGLLLLVLGGTAMVLVRRRG